MHKKKSTSLIDVVSSAIKEGKFAKNAGALGAASLVQAVMGLTLGLLVARWLSPYLYGTLALILSIPEFTFGIFNARSSEVSLRYLGKFNAAHEPRKALALCKLILLADLTIGIVSTLILILISGWAAREFIGQPEVRWAIIAYSLFFIPRALANTPRAVLLTFGHYSLVAKLNVLSQSVRFFATIPIVYLSDHYYGVIIGNALFMLVTFAGLTCFGYRITRRNWHGNLFTVPLSALRGHRRELLHFLTVINVTELMKTLVGYGDILILGTVTGVRDVGVYKFAKSMARGLAIFSAPLQTTVYQRFSSLQENRRFLWSFVKRTALLVGLPLALFTACGYILLPWLSTTIAGAKYAKALPLIPIWVTAMIFINGLFWIRPFFLSQGWSRQWLRFNVTATLCALLLLFPMTFIWGAAGTTIARISFPALLFIGSATMILKEYKNEYNHAATDSD